VPIGRKWKTAQQAIQDGNETTPSYSLFQMGALCWYFVQGLVDRGVGTPIGIADTAIGGQRIEEFMCALWAGVPSGSCSLMLSSHAATSMPPALAQTLREARDGMGWDGMGEG
jgi:hypothetical protein